MKFSTIKEHLKKFGNGTIRVANDTVTGGWLPSSFFSRHWKYILFGFLLLMIYIALRYESVVNMERVKALREELQIAKSEAVREKSHYISNIRESAMQERIDALGLELEVRDRPPYTLTINQ